MPENTTARIDGTPPPAGKLAGLSTDRLAALMVVGAVVFLAGIRMAFRSNLGG